MTNNPEMIDLTSSPSSSSSSDECNANKSPNEHISNTQVTSVRKNNRTHEMGESSKIPSSTASDSSGNTPPVNPYFPLGIELVSPFLCTSDEESSDSFDEDPSFDLPSTPERPQSRPRRTNPPIPKSQDVVIGVSDHGSQGKDKGKAKVE